MTQVSRIFIAQGRTDILEQEFVITGIRKFLPANVDEGGNRKDDLIQFYAKHGGLRTVPTKDLIL